jgi:hypothetical protein
LGYFKRFELRPIFFPEAVAGGRDPSLAEGWHGLLADLAALPDGEFKATAVGMRAGQFVRENHEAVGRLASEVGLPYAPREDGGQPFDVEAFYTELVRRRG